MTDWRIDPTRVDLGSIQPKLHPLAPLVNLAVLGWRSCCGRPRLLAPGALMRQAEKRSGLHDWGDEATFREPLQLLASPRQDRAVLTPLGRHVLERFLRERLTNRLYIQEQVSAHPEIAEEVVRRPLVIMGLPRTGTSFLQILLSLAPGCRPMRGWYTWDLRAPPESGCHDPRIGGLHRQLWFLYRFLPGLQAIHRTTAAGPEECLPLLMNSLKTDALGMLADQQEYSDWLREQDMAPAYAYYRLQLQLLQSRVPGGHWVLKSPAHLPHFAELVRALPDARIVCLHRDPRRAVPSALSMRYTVLGALNRLVPERLPELIRTSLDGLLGSVQEHLAAREAIAPDRIMDVQYADLVAAPLQTVRAIHGRFGYDWHAGFEERIAAFLAGAGKRPRHLYSAATFGVAPASIEEAFRDYVERFGIPAEV